jgi:tRNA U34 2-thiouridine synthase MnmA/TrmU
MNTLNPFDPNQALFVGCNCGKHRSQEEHVQDAQKISNDFIAKLQVLDIDFKYDKKKYENFSLEYNIVYYPLIKCDNCGSTKHRVKYCLELKKPSELKKPAETNVFTSILNHLFGFSKIQN